MTHRRTRLRHGRHPLALAYALLVATWGCSGSDGGDQTAQEKDTTDDDRTAASNPDGRSPSSSGAGGSGSNHDAEGALDGDDGGGGKPAGAGGTTGASGGASSQAPTSGGAPSTGIPLSSGGMLGATGGAPSSGGTFSATGGALSTGGAFGALGGAATGMGGTSAGLPGSAGSLATMGGIGGSVQEDPELPAAEEPPATNPFVVVSHDPLSTFAADVDTASYDTFRQYLASNTLPPASRVRVEEYVNYFAYDYPAPEYGDEVPFSISLAAAPTLMDRDTTLLRVGIQGALPPPEEKKPANLVFLVDVSGSMDSSNKLPLVQYTVAQTLDILEPTDTVSIVTYGSTAQVALPPTAAADREDILRVVNGLAASGGTAGADGLGLAYQQAELEYIEGGINHVVLCTDGDFNVGPYTTTEIVELVREKRDTGVTLTALGFGINNDAMMEAVSNAGNGMYGVITDQDQATTYVTRRMLSTLVHIAKDVKIQVEFNPEHVYAYRLIGYENRAIADSDFRDDVVDAGEIGAGHRVTALYELVPADTSLPNADGAPPAEDGEAYEGEVEIDPSALVLVKVRYKDVDASDEDPAYEVAQTLLPDAVAESYASLDADFQWAIGMASFAELLKGSPYADPSMLGIIDDIVHRPAHESDPERAEFVTLFERAVPLLLADPGDDLD